MKTYSETTESIFPVLTHIDQLRDQVKHKDEIKFMTQANGTIVCSYVVSMQDTFDTPHARECRGIVFNAAGQVISRPLSKFFNVNEKPSTLVENINWGQIVRVMDKRDGSMIHTVAHPSDLGNFTLKSKKSYESSVAVSAMGFIRKNEDANRELQQALPFAKIRNRYADFCSDMINIGKTAIFEWTSPYARIVLAYAKDELKLLHVRDNVTGEYMTRDELQSQCDRYGIPMGDHCDDVFNTIMNAKDSTEIKAYLLNYAETLENFEGLVLQFANGDMVKLKTKWYMERHRAMTFLRQRDIALMVLRESLDDLKALLVGEGADISEILEIEKKVVEEVNAIQKSVESAYESMKHLDRKEFALHFSKSEGGRHPYFGLLMHKYSGKEPDYKEFYERNVLPNIPLIQINLLQSEAEAE